MNSIHTVKQTLKEVDEYRNFILAGAALLTSVVLLVLATSSCHFSTVTPHWVSHFSPRVLQTSSLNRLIIYFAAGGMLAGAGLYMLKDEICYRKSKHKSEKKEGTSQVGLFRKKLEEFSNSREARFLGCVFKIIILFAAVLLIIYGIMHLASLHQIKDLNTNTQKFYSLGYWDKGHTIEYLFASLVGGGAIGMWSLCSLSDKFKLKD